MGMGTGLREAVHRCDARVAPVENLGPLCPRASCECCCDPLSQGRPPARVHLVGGLHLDTEPTDELVVELWLDRPDGHVLAVRCLIASVKRRPPVEQVGFAPILPDAV